MRANRCFFSFFVLTVMSFLFIKQAYAITFDLIAPSGTLTQGQDVTFTVNIDTEGQSVSSIQTGITYDTQYLEYKSVTTGATMDSVVADTTTYGTGKVLFSGTKTNGLNGSGVFATVTFTLIAQNPGSTEICTLWTPTSTTIEPSATPPSTITSIISTTAPQPTALPQTGVTDSRNTGVIFAFMAILAAGGIFILSQKEKYIQPKNIAHFTKKTKKNK